MISSSLSRSTVKSSTTCTTFAAICASFPNGMSQGFFKGCTLDSPDDYYEWESYISDMVPPSEWQFYDPDRTETYEAPAKPTPSSVRPTARGFLELTPDEREAFILEFQDYKSHAKEYRERTEHERILWTAILETVNPSLRPRGIESWYNKNRVREMLAAIRDSLRPSAEHMQRTTTQLHRELFGTNFTQWPKGGPGEWLAKWDTVNALASRWDPLLLNNWKYDLSRQWAMVPGMGPYCERLMDMKSETPYNAAHKVREACSFMNYTQPADVSEGSDRSRTSASRKRKSQHSNHGQDKQQKRQPCTACEEGVTNLTLAFWSLTDIQRTSLSRTVPDERLRTG